MKQAAVGTGPEDQDLGVGPNMRGPRTLILLPRPREIVVSEGPLHAILDASIDHQMARAEFPILLVHDEFEAEEATPIAESKVGGDHLVVDFKEIEREIVEARRILGDLVIERAGALVAGNGAPDVALPAHLFEVVELLNAKRIGGFNSPQAQGAARAESSDPLAHARAKVRAAVRTPRILVSAEGRERDIGAALRFPARDEQPIAAGHVTQTVQCASLRHITELQDIPMSETTEGLPDRRNGDLALEASAPDYVEPTRVAIGRSA